MKTTEKKSSLADFPAAESIPPIETSLDLNPEAQACLSRADIEYKKGDLHAVCTALKEALRSAPNSVPLLECLGNVQFQMGEHVAAFESFQSAAENDANNADLLVRLAIAAVQCEKVQIFEKTMERIFAMDPENAAAHRFLAKLNVTEQNYTKAAQHFCRVIQKEPDDIESLLTAGECYLKLNNRPLARYMYEQALKAEPQNQIAQDKISEMRMQDQVAEAAEAATQKSAFTPPPEPVRSLESLIEEIRRDRVGRPHYAHGLLLATLQAMKIGLKEMAVFEFGVAYGDGLLDLCSTCQRITEDTGFRFKIYGFDSDIGMPEVRDYRDHPEIWYTGQFKTDHSLLTSRLPENAKLVVGDISKTIGPFCKASLSAECPVGFVAIDVDLYSSAKAAFKLFKGKPEYYLPAVVMYFDDVHDMITWNSWCGEELAVKEFNRANKFRKIEQKWTRQNSANAGWHDSIYCCHVLDHPVRSGKLKCASLDLNVTIY